MVINLIDITKTNDIIKIIKEFRMKLDVNDDDFKEEYLERCAEIMVDDGEEKVIQFIKDNYDCEYKSYVAELIEPYFEKTKSKRFIQELWSFFKKEKKLDNSSLFVDWTESIMVENDWQDEDWAQ